MTEPSNDWMTIWQRRLRYSLDDKLARELAEALQMRIRTFEQSTDRVLGQRAIRVRNEIAFLTVESDDFDTPIVRLVGPAQLRPDLSTISTELDASISRLEAGQRRRGQISHGTPIWVPFPDAADSDAVRLILPVDELESIMLWPAEHTAEPRNSSVAGLGLIVDSVDEATRRGVTAGGVHLTDFTMAAGAFAQLLAPGRMPVLLWQPAEAHEVTAVRARLDAQSPNIVDIVEFFRNVVGWRSEVIHADPLTALLAHEGSRVGIVLENPEIPEHEVSVLSNRPQKLVRSATQAAEYTVQSMPLRFPLGRRWSITDASGMRLTLADEPDADSTSSHLRRSWLHLPTAVLVAVADLQAAFDLLERTLREILVAVPAPPPSEQSSSLLGVLASALDPAVSRIVGLLRDSNHPGQILEGLAGERPAVQGLVDDLAAVAQSLEDENLVSAYRRTRMLLIRSGLLAEAPGAMEESSVRL